MLPKPKAFVSCTALANLAVAVTITSHGAGSGSGERSAGGIVAVRCGACLCTPITDGIFHISWKRTVFFTEGIDGSLVFIEICQDTAQFRRAHHGPSGHDTASDQADDDQDDGELE